MELVEHLKQGVICLSGPTAAGKTALAMQLYDALPVELVSVDSALIYRGMDIGTAKPTAAEREAYPHHLIDIRDPAQVYSAAEFRRDCLLLIEEIRSRGRIPLLVGGTMLYYRALLAGLSTLPEANPKIRQSIQERADQEGWEVLHQSLAAVDPAASERIHPNDPQRIMRALEVFELTGRSLTDLTASQAPGLALPSWQIVAAPPERTTLHMRIETRFHHMLAAGFEEEVRSLFARGDLHSDLPAVRAVGYRQMWQYLEGRITYDEMIERAVIATRQLAKRQITWLRSWIGAQWINPEEDHSFEQVIQRLSRAPVQPHAWMSGRN